jgi:hypothetical protein
VIEKRRHEVTVPKRNLALTTARILRVIAPSLLRKGMARMEPVPPEIVERARAQAQAQARAQKMQAVGVQSAPGSGMLPDPP